MIDRTEKPQNPSKFAKYTARYSKFRYDCIVLAIVYKWQRRQNNTSQRVLLQLIHWRTDNDYMTTRLHYVNIDLHRQCGIFFIKE